MDDDDDGDDVAQLQYLFCTLKDVVFTYWIVIFVIDLVPVKLVDLLIAQERHVF
jgi:hypothetical protein